MRPIVVDEPELLAKTLEFAVYAVLFYGMEQGLNTHETMRHFERMVGMLNRVNRVIIESGRGDRRDTA